LIGGLQSKVTLIFVIHHHRDLIETQEVSMRRTQSLGKLIWNDKIQEVKRARRLRRERGRDLDENSNVMMTQCG
jgi:hypothetical protein